MVSNARPMETLVIDVPETTFKGRLELVTQRKGLKVMEPKGDIQHLEFEIPSRGIIGLRNNILTATQGETVMTHRFIGFEPHKAITYAVEGSLVSMEQGQALPYAIDRLQDRWVDFFIDQGAGLYRSGDR